MTSFIVAAVILMMIGAASFYIIKEKKKGTVCIGCPHAGTCASKKDSNSECGCQ